MKILNESSMSKLYDYMKNYDIVCISADKYLPDRRDYVSQKEYEDTYRDRLGKYKKLDSRTLVRELRAKYHIVQIKGFYQYQAGFTPSKEKSFFVVNSTNNPNFKEELLQKGVDCKQNSIYYVPKGTLVGWWIYTGIDLSEPDHIDKLHNFGDEEFRGPVHFGSYVTSKDGETGYSLVKGRPFASYETGNGEEIKTKVEIPKTHNIHNNITIIDEALEEYDMFPITREAANHINKVHSYIKQGE